MKNYEKLMHNLDIIQNALNLFSDMLDKIEENAEQELQRKAA